jgi:hypothetical protein
MSGTDRPLYSRDSLQSIVQKLAISVRMFFLKPCVNTTKKGSRFYVRVEMICS